MQYGNLKGTARNALLPEAVQSQIMNAVAGIRFGAVQIVIHEGKVVQIERREKVGFERGP